MIELSAKRNLNAKHFDLGNGSFVMEAHQGHIHYFDKLDSKELRGIDWVLVWDDKKKGWGFKYHSYRPFIPEYSDGVAEFRDLFNDKDQTIKYKAICENKVKGELIERDDNNPAFDNNIDNKGIIYRDAFGSGRDYMLYNTRSSLVKVATVNNPNEQKEDAVFEWEVELPTDGEKELDIYRAENVEDVLAILADTKLDVAYKLDISEEKVFDSTKQTLIGNVTEGENEDFTYLRTYKAWDSDGNMIAIEAKLYEKDGKRILRKTIPVEFLQKAVGRVFTDTTTSYYVGAGDGSVTSDPVATSWDTAHDDTSGVASYTGTNDYIQAKAPSNARVRRGFFPADTSGLPDGATISAVELKIYFTAKVAPVSDDIGIVQTTQASTSSLVGGDLDKCGTINSPTEGATRVNVSAITTGQYTTFTLDVVGRGWVEDTGYTKLGLRYGDDIDDTNPGDNNYIYFDTSEQTGTTSDPYLSITYTSGTNYTKDLDETIALADSKATQITAKAVKEAVTLVDTFSFSLAIIIAETLALVDTVSKVLVTSIDFTESISANDTTDTKQTGKGVTESLTVVDTINKIFTISKTLSEIITLVESIDFEKQFFKVLTETVTMVDSLSKILVSGIRLVESISVVDSLFGLLNGVNMKYNRKYSENADDYVDKYNDV